MTAQVSDFDRFSFMLFLALAVHAALVLGITFAPETPRTSAQTMEITLAQFDDQEAPDDADFLAQTSQQGSGTEAEARELTSPQPTPVNEVGDQPVQPEPPSRVAPAQRSERQLVRTEGRSRPAADPDMAETFDEPLPVQERRSLMERSLEIASLEARFSAQQQAYARRPRVLRVTAASTLSSDNAWYVQNWVDKINRVGNMNYPQEARQNSIYGQLRMLVLLRKDGTIKRVEILESSGYSVLDDAAIQIVRMAAPFQAFTERMQEQTDEIEIIRTWSFQPKGLTSG
ncbi:energy transducer TonB [Marinobacter mobilis]|uniref:Protein TonB n=1 Tax=Marinobacter mobilis TaxID=488533 RepID=A0A1H2WZ47_9GAMM|nr:TonB family protein [Marinobacter mobilis]SDW85865.1 protein TonB [Marinobacter mobilis]SDX67558.1 protein TonB [Marinobacter mobilis]